MPRYLTKSGFKLAAECPTKLFYAAHPELYADQNDADPFLDALKAGGFQVGELAKLLFPGGREIKATTHDDQVAETNKLLALDEVTIFEAAIRYGHLFARVDVLVKRGAEVELIEVKATSYDPDAPPRPTADWLPYLRDIAFQHHVFSLAHPALRARGFLMMPDKTRRCTVDRLGERFRIRRGPKGPLVELVPGAAEGLGEPILAQVDVHHEIARVQGSDLVCPGGYGPFAEVIANWAEALQADHRLPARVGLHCRKCQFRNPVALSDKRSGFHECWSQAPGATPERLARGTVLDVWKLRPQKILEAGRLWLDEISEADLARKANGDALGIGERQRMQLTGTWPGGGPFFLSHGVLRAEMARWRFPLRFLDFEAARPVIPVTRGMRPYALLPFQFSLHTMDAGGRVAHAHEFLAVEPGQDPTLPFLRALHAALGNEGTVLMWSPYERSVLRELDSRMREDPAPAADAQELRAMIAALCDEGGAREMADMCALAERAFFHPATQGSSSIKRVLPAVLGESAHLRQRYSAPVYGAPGGISSRNFRDQTWYREEGGKVLNPYELLRQAFVDPHQALVEPLVSSDEIEIADGGAAATAWASLQFETVGPAERRHIANALLRYCELDTLAMAMVCEAWRDWCSELELTTDTEAEPTGASSWGSSR